MQTTQLNKIFIAAIVALVAFGGVFYFVNPRFMSSDLFCGNGEQPAAPQKHTETQATTVSNKTALQNDTHLKWLDWNEGYEKAKKENKILIMDVYTDWCGWCKRMDRDTYEKAEVIEAINKDFVAVKMNPEKTGSYKLENKEVSGRELVAQLSNGQLRGYPSTIFVFPGTPDRVHFQPGYLNAEQFTGLLTQIKGAKTMPENSNGAANH